MLLWTIQPEEAWRILRRDGVYRCNPDKATHLNEDIDFSSAYDWMAAIHSVSAQYAPRFLGLNRP